MRFTGCRIEPGGIDRLSIDCVAGDGWSLSVAPDAGQAEAAVDYTVSFVCSSPAIDRGCEAKLLTMEQWYCGQTTALIHPANTSPGDDSWLAGPLQEIGLQSVWQNWFTSGVRLQNFNRFMSSLPHSRKMHNGKPLGVGLHGAPDATARRTVLPKMRVAAVTGSSTGSYVAQADGLLVFEFAAPQLGLFSLASWIGSKPDDAATFRFRVERTQRKARPLSADRNKSSRREYSAYELQEELRKAAQRERALRLGLNESSESRAHRQLKLEREQRVAECAVVVAAANEFGQASPPRPGAEGWIDPFQERCVD
eukprot:SAG31_NODE_4343_length_3333_cov_1.727891_1_plen_310_part_00